MLCRKKAQGFASGFRDGLLGHFLTTKPALSNVERGTKSTKTTATASQPRMGTRDAPAEV